MCLIIFSAVTCWTGMKPALYRPTFRWHINLSLCSVVPLSPLCASTLMASEMGIGGVGTAGVLLGNLGTRATSREGSSAY